MENFDEAFAALTADTDNNNMYVHLKCHDANTRIIVIGGDTGGKKTFLNGAGQTPISKNQTVGRNGGCGTWFEISERHTQTLLGLSVR